MKIGHYYAGIGGTIEKFDDVEHEITNIEINPQIAAVLQERKPRQKVLVTDARQHLLDHHNEFDFVWLSKPCQSHSRMMKFTRHKLSRYPDLGLYEEILFLQHFFKGKWVVENVVPYYQPLIKPTAQIGRHLFWSNFEIPQMENVPKSPKGMMNLATVGQKKIMMDWLGIHYDKNIYYEGNHCPVQVLRNCVHPDLGLHVFNAAKEEKQQSIFSLQGLTDNIKL